MSSKTEDKAKAEEPAVVQEPGLAVPDTNPLGINRSAGEPGAELAYQEA